MLYVVIAGWDPIEVNLGYFSAVQRGLKGNKIAGAGGREKKKERLKGQSTGAWTKCRLEQGVGIRWQSLCSSLLGMAVSGLSQRAAVR